MCLNVTQCLEYTFVLKVSIWLLVLEVDYDANTFMISNLEYELDKNVNKVFGILIYF